MDTRWLILILVVVGTIVIARSVYAPDKPNVTYYEKELFLPSEPYCLHTMELWEILSKEIRFDNASAIFRSLAIDIAPNGTTQSITFDFSATTDGEGGIHRAFVNESSQVYLTSQRFEMKNPGDHPLAVLRGVDQLPMSTVAIGERGCDIYVFHHMRGKTFMNVHGTIFALANGVMTPLHEVTFPTGCSWYEIEIVPKTDPIVIVPESTTSSRIGSGTAIPCEENPECTIIFTEGELAKAENISFFSSADAREKEPEPRDAERDPRKIK